MFCSCLDLGSAHQTLVERGVFSETLGSRNTDPAGATRTDRLHIFHHYKLVFSFAGNYYFIRGKLKWEAYLIKIQSGTNIALSYSSLSNLSLAYFSQSARRDRSSQGSISLAMFYWVSARSLIDQLEGRLVLSHRSGFILVNAFDKPLWSSDLLQRLAKGLCHVGAVAHLGVVAHLNSLLSV